VWWNVLPFNRKGERKMKEKEFKKFNESVDAVIERIEKMKVKEK